MGNSNSRRRERRTITLEPRTSAASPAGGLGQTPNAASQLTPADVSPPRTRRLQPTLSAPAAPRGTTTSSNPTPTPTPPGPALQEVPTIQNPINLRPKSLSVRPRPGDPNVLELSFIVDSTAPCAVSTFVLCQEIPGSQELSAPFRPAPRAHLPAGLGQSFPPPEAQPGLMRGAYREQTIDLSRYDVDSLLAPAAGTIPVAIRLEAILPTARPSMDVEAHGKQLDDGLAPGGPLPSWVAALTTHVALSQVGTSRTDGTKYRESASSSSAATTWHAVVTAQSIFFEGVTYELHEIFGLSATTAGVDGTPNLSQSTGMAVEEDNLNDECVVCLTENREVALLPCRHMCMCKECAKIMMTSGTGGGTLRSKCPICREPVMNFITNAPLAVKGTA